MTQLLLFSVVLFVAVLSSCFATRTAASIPVLFIAAGFLFGHEAFGMEGWPPSRHAIGQLGEWALVAVLFTDGMHAGVRELREAWHLPGRALLLGLPLTLLVIAALAHVVAGLAWLPALLLAAVLTPTDPVFASALVEREDVALPLRRLLNVESGVNDGLALPIVVVLVQLLTGESPHPARLLAEVIGGAALGAALPWLARALRPRIAAIAPESRPLYGLAVGLCAVALAKLLGINEFLAAFFAGVGLASVDPGLRDDFQRMGRHIGELLKLATLLAFGALLSGDKLLALTPMDYLFAALALFVARPLGLLIALLGSRLDTPHRLAAAWFGPKGFATLVYAIFVLDAGVPGADHLFHICAVVVTASIVLHSSTDVATARWLTRGRGSQARE